MIDRRMSGIALLTVFAAFPLGAQANSVVPPFRIVVDGHQGDSATVCRGVRTDCQDHLLDRMAIAVRVDPLDVTPVLNVTVSADVALRQGIVRFVSYTNYSTWITRQELRVFRSGVSVQGTPFAVVPGAATANILSWTADVPRDVGTVSYVLRVYDANGAFDETRPKSLDLVDRDRPAGDETTAIRESRTGYGENSRLIANIPVTGATVTVNGNVPGPGSTVRVMNRPVPIDPAGRFAARELLPLGPHTVTVSVIDSAGAHVDVQRDITVERQNWFSVALADLTLGRNSVTGPAALVTGDNSARYSGNSYASGRLAFYLKGRLAGHTLLTASADTREQPIADLFSNFGQRDPQALLRRLDPNTVYPEYGDDGALVVDAPTQGNAYLKLEHDDSHLMWGSFRTQLAGTDLVSYSRGLYGGELQLRNMGATKYGERRTELTAFAADPGTIGAREEFRGTGGSLFYLQNQDVLLGSERLRVEVRDRDSDLLLESTTLVANQDYEVNALQGRITLRTPLASVADRPGLVRVGALDGNPVYLVVTYEFTPGVTRLGNLTEGGRASSWVTDHVRLGATGYKQDGVGMAQELLGGDVTLRYTAGTYLRVERAHSTGVGGPSLLSLNGGFNFTDLPHVGDENTTANASRFETGVDLKELFGGALGGKLTGYWLDRDAGFSAPGQLTSEGVKQFGFAGDVPLGTHAALSAKADLRDGAATGASHAVELGGRLGVGKAVALRMGVRYDRRGGLGLLGAAGPFQQELGARTDATARLEWDPVDDRGTHLRWGVYGLAQGTVSRDAGRTANDRYGIGAHYQLNNRTDLSGEITDGTTGTGGRLGADVRVSDRSSLYLNYLSDVDRSDQGYRGRTGSFNTGARVRFSDATSVFAERRQESSDQGQAGLMTAFGLDLAPTDRWTWGLKLEQGRIQQLGAGALDRKAASLSAGYGAGAVHWGGVLEYRTETGMSLGHRESWLVKNTLSIQASTDWRLIGRANFATSNGAISTMPDAQYTEVVAGLAYRPAHNNRVNGLLRYTLLNDLSSPGQLAAQLLANPFAQRSQVVAADGIFALTNKLSLGGKVGYRFGQIRDNSVPDAQWTNSRAWLGIVRGDWHVVNSWDVLAELRSLRVSDAKSAKQGVLIGIYRQVTGNFKVGAGYNFTDFSDELTDLRYRSRGLFLNVIGQQ